MPTINFTDPRFWVDLFQIAGMVVIALVLFARRPGEEAAKDLAALDKRVIVLEQKISNVATTTELAKLAGLVQVIESQGEAQAERLNTISNQIRGIDTYLRENK